jgi:hypothetical protein
MTQLVDDGALRGCELPEGVDWPQQTLEMWEQLRRSPMAATWLPADWSHLIDTALLHARLWQGDTRIASEVRLRLAQFGVTPEARLRLRQLVTDNSPTSSTPVLDDLMRRRQERNNKPESKKGSK